jgi:hypothetical protein
LGRTVGSRSEIGCNSRFAAQFVEAKRRVGGWGFGSFLIHEDFDSYVFEPYAALMLGTRLQLLVQLTWDCCRFRYSDYPVAQPTGPEQSRGRETG